MLSPAILSIHCAIVGGGDMVYVLMFIQGNPLYTMLKKATLTLLALGLLVPAISLAQTTDTSSAIAALLAQIQQLEQQIAQLKGGATSSCVNLSSNLTLGSSGNDITNLQNYLIAKGDLAAGNNTGYYGYITTSAVGQLQLSLGIVSSSNDSAYGIMGPRTRAAVGCSGLNNPSPTPTPVSNPQPTATIDQSSLTTTTGGKDAALATITGSAYNVSQLQANLDGADGGAQNATVINNHWSVTFPSVFPGMYTVTVQDSDTGSYTRQLAAGTLIVSGNSTQPSATIDQSSLTTGYVNSTITGTAANTSSVVIDLKGIPSVTAPVSNGRWSAQIPYYTSGTYTIQVSDSTDSMVLTTGTLSILPRGNALQPTATIDQSSLQAPAINTPFTIIGTAIGVQSIRVAIGKNGTNYFSSAAYPITNGSWSVPVHMGLDAGTYGIVVLGYTDSAGTQPVSGAGEGGIISGGNYVVVPNTNGRSVISLGVCPANATAQRGQNGQEFSCTCQANYMVGNVFGNSTAYFTDNSDICTAGAQAGQLNLATGGLLNYTILSGQNSYAGITQNSITSQAWGSWPGSFQITGPKG